MLDDISPESIGELIAVWENKTIFNSMFWDINPFDQWGVELGKINTKVELENNLKDQTSFFLMTQEFINSSMMNFI